MQAINKGKGVVKLYLEEQDIKELELGLFDITSAIHLLRETGTTFVSMPAEAVLNLVQTIITEAYEM